MIHGALLRIVPMECAKRKLHQAQNQVTWTDVERKLRGQTKPTGHEQGESRPWQRVASGDLDATCGKWPSGQEIKCNLSECVKGYLTTATLSSIIPGLEDTL